MPPQTARLREFLESIVDPARPAIEANDLTVVVAHPDDETIGCGALLARLSGVRLIVVTDGAPHDLKDAHAYGFASAEAYAAARTYELFEAMARAGIRRDQISQLGIPDQQAAHNLAPVTAQLARVFAKHNTGVVLTLAYEGGHPDHDATAFCAHQAARRSARPMGIVEMPLYRAGDSGALNQSFAPGDGKRVILELTPEERHRKARMVAAHRTQKNVLAGFSLDREQFRPAPAYDFRALPNGGKILYDRENWGIDSTAWLRCANAALHDEGAPA